MTGRYSVIATPAEIAAELGLSALFLMGVDGDSSRYNHATGLSGTIVGTPSYGTGYATFPAGAWIDTGVPETAQHTLFGATAKTAAERFIIGNFNNENELISGLKTTGFGQYKLQHIVCGDRVSFANEIGSATTDDQESQKEANKPICGIGSYGASGPVRLWEPRRSEDVTATISGAGVRVVVGSNYLIGGGPGAVAASTIHAAAKANAEMDDYGKAALFVWMSKHLQTKQVYL